jgi:hypothetical protein
MIPLIDWAQRPHCAVQPRWRKSPAIVRGGVLEAIAILTSWSLRTLQEQMIIAMAQTFGLGGEVESFARFADFPQCAASTAGIARCQLARRRPQTSP